MSTQASDTTLGAAFDALPNANAAHETLSLRRRAAGMLWTSLLNPRRSVLGPLVLYLLLASVMLRPFAGNRFRGAGDLYAVIGGFVEAKNAFREGQFPLRVPPRQLDGSRYPIFHFYGNFPFTLGGLIYTLTSANCYTAWKMAAGSMLIVGAFYTYRTAMRFTRNVPASVLAGAIFMTSPYIFADFARGAYTEFVGFNLLPVALYYGWRSFVSPRLRYVLLNAVSWSLIGMSHNIVYLYGPMFFAVFFLSMAIMHPRKNLRRLVRLVIGGLLHFPLLAWYTVAQLTVLKSLMIFGRTTSPMSYANLTSLSTLLWPKALTPAVSSTPNLTLQVGAPILIGILLALPVLFIGRRRKAGLVVRLLLVFLIAFFMVWSPIDFWVRLPKLMYFVQFPYRLLMFVVLFGSLIAACGLAFISRRGINGWQGLALFLLLGISVGTYTPSRGVLNDSAIPQQKRMPMMGGLEDYTLTTHVTAQSSYFLPGLNFAQWEFGLTREGLLFEPTEAWVPTPPRADTLRIEGTLPRDAVVADVIVLLNSTRLLKQVAAGPFSIDFPVADIKDRRPAFMKIDAMMLDHNFATVALDRIAFEPQQRQPGDPLLVPAATIRPDMHYGKCSSVQLQLKEPSRVQVPILYYPKLLSVRDNGREISYGNLGRFITVDLASGSHVLDIELVGVRWANWLSLIGWVGLLVMLAVLSLRRSRRWVRSFLPTRENAQRLLTMACYGPVAFGAVMLGGALGKALPDFKKPADGQAGMTFAASSSANEDQTIDKAFDNRAITSWAAQNTGPAWAKIQLAQPQKLTGIELEARETSLFECWKNVRVVLSFKEKLVLEQEFKFPDAWKHSSEKITLQPTEVDTIELFFSEPVLTTRAGQGVPASAVSPGYKEIRLQWSK